MSIFEYLKVDFNKNVSLPEFNTDRLISFEYDDWESDWNA